MRTIVFTVHEPPNPPVDRIERAEQLEFVRDGFSAIAAAVPPLWMVMHRLWITLLLYLLASTGLSLALAMMGVDKTLIGLINLAANVVIGFEASSLQRWTLGRRNWSEIGTVVGRNRAECERRFFDGWLVGQPVLRRSAVLAAPATAEHQAFAVTQGSAGSELSEGSDRPLWRRLLRR
ncbi:MAG: DUF2628 domain-containing protein [Hyphomicrobiaceae bacterium]